MIRNRKRRITGESELLEGPSSDGPAIISTSRSRINFMEEVNYKMEEAT